MQEKRSIPASQFKDLLPDFRAHLIRTTSLRRGSQARRRFFGNRIAATVGVAFGLSSDITSEAADAVIMEPSLGKVDELMHIGRRMRRIALESAVGGMGLNVLGIIGLLLVIFHNVAGSVAQEVIDLLAVLNAVRVAMPFDALTDF